MLPVEIGAEIMEVLEAMEAKLDGLAEALAPGTARSFPDAMPYIAAFG
jgi:hypothetical protein